MSPLRLLVASLLVLGVATGCSGSKAGYSKATEGVFLSSCNPDDNAARSAVCRCAYAEVTKRFSYAQYVDLNKRLEADNNDVPSDILALVAACAAPSSSGTSSS
ncbi:MAG: hypothetical protein ACR2LQ_04870 [Acidimicrobiales bacterium]